MSKIDDFTIAQKKHEELIDIIGTSKKDGNNLGIPIAKRDDIYSMIAFSFSNRRSDRHRYENSDRLTEFIGQACDELRFQIVDKAIELSSLALLSKAAMAKEEAENVLKIIN